MPSTELQNLVRKLSQKYLAKESRAQVRNSFQKAFQKKKNEMIAEFLNHPVSLEIKGGVSAKNISGTLGGITNLFSFIGFDSTDNPIDSVVQVLQTTTFEQTSYRANKINYKVNLPSKDQIFDATPLPYIPGRSWAKGIETGISGLGFYLKKRSNVSRSGFGIQSKYQTRKGVKFRNIKYISSLLKKYEIEFKNLQI